MALPAQLTVRIRQQEQALWSLRQSSLALEASSDKQKQLIEHLDEYKVTLELSVGVLLEMLETVHAHDADWDSELDTTPKVQDRKRFNESLMSLSRQLRSKHQTLIDVRRELEESQSRHRKLQNQCQHLSFDALTPPAIFDLRTNYQLDTSHSSSAPTSLSCFPLPAPTALPLDSKGSSASTLVDAFTADASTTSNGHSSEASSHTDAAMLGIVGEHGKRLLPLLRSMAKARTCFRFVRARSRRAREGATTAAAHQQARKGSLSRSDRGSQESIWGNVPFGSQTLPNLTAFISRHKVEYPGEIRSLRAFVRALKHTVHNVHRKREERCDIYTLTVDELVLSLVAASGSTETVRQKQQDLIRRLLLVEDKLRKLRAQECVRGTDGSMGGRGDRLREYAHSLQEHLIAQILQPNAVVSLSVSPAIAADSSAPASMVGAAVMAKLAMELGEFAEMIPETVDMEEVIEEERGELGHLKQQQQPLALPYLSVNTEPAMADTTNQSRAKSNGGDASAADGQKGPRGPVAILHKFSSGESSVFSSGDLLGCWSAYRQKADQHKSGDDGAGLYPNRPSSIAPESSDGCGLALPPTPTVVGIACDVQLPEPGIGGDAGSGDEIEANMPKEGSGGDDCVLAGEFVIVDGAETDSRGGSVKSDANMDDRDSGEEYATPASLLSGGHDEEMGSAGWVDNFHSTVRGMGANDRSDLPEPALEGSGSSAERVSGLRTCDSFQDFSERMLSRKHTTKHFFCLKLATMLV